MDIEFDPAKDASNIAKLGVSLARAAEFENAVFDDDNPEWTEQDFARARPVSDNPELAAAFPRSRGGRPCGSGKELVSLRIDKDVLDRFRAAGPGWQTRINEALRRIAP